MAMQRRRYGVRALVMAAAAAITSMAMLAVSGIALAEPASGVSARISFDEREIVLSLPEGELEGGRVAFDVWGEQDGEGSRMRRGAVQLEDGTWTAKLFVASTAPLEAGVPYHCAVENAVHRLYNPYTYQHFYTSSTSEADSLSKGGWSYEGVSWIAPESSADAAPVYRLYNPYSGDHLYTTSKDEYDSLAAGGWTPEEVAFRSDPASSQPVYRLYNPYATVGAHHYTTNTQERDVLVGQGWKDEGTCWFGAGANADGSWSLPAGNAPLTRSGTYHVAAVALGEDGAETPLGEGAFTVSAPSASVSIERVDNVNGTFDVVVQNVQSASGVLQVEVPVWSASDQHDIVWYPASRQGDGTYRATVRASEHEAATDYTAHVYLRTGNGLHENVAHITCTLALENFLCLTGGPNTYTLWLTNPGPASSVAMPTWSEEGGQDDLVWYEATQEGNRWRATINTNNLLHSGRCNVHVYVDGTFGMSFAFNVSPKEVLTLRQRAILKAAGETPSIGYGYCAGWVSLVLMNAGQPYRLSDNANDMYYRLPLTDLDELLPGMCISVSTHSHTPAGRKWGHVGIYMGNGQVVDEYGYIRYTSLDWWVEHYGDRVPVHFGFLVY